MPEPRKLFERLRTPRVAIPTGAVLVTGATAGVVGFFLNQWVYVVVTLIVLLIALLIYLVYTMYAREREERGARGTGADDSMTVVGRREERHSSAPLEERFRKALAVVVARKLDALPWYLVIGSPGAGKTALLRASGVELPSAVESLVEGGPTSSISLWLTNQAVFVDTAGRLTAAHAGGDHQDWKTLLGLIRKHRPRPAIQGVVLAVSIPELFGRSNEELEEAASELRRHVNDIADTLGVDAPIYLVATQADRLQGFAEAAGLAATRLGETFGWTNRDRYPHDIAQTVREAILRIRERVEGALPELLVRETDRQRARRVFLLPHELNQLSRALAAFVGRAFQPTRYDEVPFLRGVYVTSAVRGGALVSPVLERFGQRWAASAVDTSVSPGGWFTRDLFRKLMLDGEEQSLAVATDTVGPRTRTVLLAVAGVFSLVCVGLWGASFWNNWKTISVLRTATEDAISQRHSLEAQDQLRARVEDAESSAGRPWRSFGLGSAAGRGIRRAKEAFALSFGAEFERPAKAELLGKVQSREPSAFAALLDLVADVSFLTARGADDAIRPGIERYGPVQENATARAAFASGYTAFVRWAPDVELQTRIEEERRRFEDEAAGLLEIGRLEAWCGERADVGEPVRAKDFGLPAPPESAGVSVPACYTRKFFERWLGSVFSSLESSNAQAESSVARFRDDYARRYGDAWLNFLVSVPRTPLPDRNVRGSPYIRLLETAIENTQIEGLWRGEAPAWVRALHEVRREDSQDEKEVAPWKRYLAALDAVSEEVERAEGVPNLAFDTAKKVGERVDTPYKKAIEDIKALIPIPPDDPDRTAKQALQTLLEMPVLNGFSAVLQTAAKEIDLRWANQIVSRFPPPLSPEQYDRLCGPGGALDSFRQNELGPFWMGSGPRPLLEDRALPVSERFADYVARGCSGGGGGAGGGGGGGALPTGVLRVRLEGSPSEVSGADGVFVLSRVLALSCATRDVQSFEYNEGAGQQVFSWTPDCDLVQLSVRVRSSDGREEELVREWSGQFAMANFLSEGQGVGNGTYQWTVRDSLGSDLRVQARYKRRGGEDIIRFKEVASRALPRSATSQE